MLYSREFNKLVAERLTEGGIFQQWFPFGEEKQLQALLRSLTDIFPYVRSYKSVEGWGFHFLASMQPFETPLAEKIITRLPASAKRDLMEWTPQMSIKSFLNLTLQREVPVKQLLNLKDESIYISDDQPFNEYFLVRGYRDMWSENFRLIR